MTADARVDNREDLISALRLQPGPLDQNTDSHIILAAYEKWGYHCASRIVGDFAFCIRDERRDAVFCSRDGAGDRPFYYYLCDDFFAFASEIKALVALDGVPCSLNETMIGDYLIGMYDDQEITFYKGIRRLHPGHSITVGRDFHRIERHWSLDPHRELRLGSDRAYAEAFRDIFTEAVRCRLRTVHPVVSALSGGLDSSSVTCVARNLLGESGGGPLHTLSLIYENVPVCDERPYINAVIAQGGISPHFLPGDASGDLPYIACAMQEHDDPFDAPTSHTEVLASVRSLSGVRIGLDGFDGDTTVSHGYGYWIELARHLELRTLYGEVAAIAGRQKRPCWPLMWRKAIKPQTPAQVRRIWRFLTGRGQHPWHRSALIDVAFARRIGLKERFHALQGHRLKPLTSSRYAHFYALTWGGLIQHTEQSNKLASRYSVEVRHPFRDTRLMEFCLGLPSEQKLSSGWPRRVLRIAMEGILPEEVRWRPDKTDFASSFTHWALSLERRVLEQAILDSSDAIADYVDVKKLKQVYEKFLARDTGVSLFDIRSVASLGLWLSRSGLSS